MTICKKGILAAVLCIISLGGIYGQAVCDADTEISRVTAAQFSPTKNHKKINKEIVSLLKHRHYLKINFDDRLSQKVLDRYLDELDPNHSYFFDSDIKEFQAKYHDKLDNAFEDADLKPGFEIFNRYQQRITERLTFLLERIGKGFDDLDFTIDESLIIDRKDLPWPGPEAAMQELWRKRLKSEVLSLKLAEKPLSEIQETLQKRYRNQLNRIQQNSGDDVFEFYMNALALSIDPHTQYFSPHRTENFNINMSLSLEGIGAVLQSEDEYTKILRLIPGGPAEQSKKLKAGDRIVGVAQGEDGEMLDIVGWRLDEVVNIIRGPKGTLVRLQIIPADAVDVHQTRIVQIVRDKVKLEEQAAKKSILEIEREGKMHKIGVIDIPTFYADFKGMNQGNPEYKSTTRDVEQLLRELNEAEIEGVIVDLRDDGGGSLQEANSLVGLFIGLGPTVQVRNANGRIDIIRDHDPKMTYSGPIIVLVNRMSASASEIFAGAIQDYNRGIVIGEQTFGKGTVQSLMPLSKGQLKATTAKYYRISGKSTQNKGVIPDLEYPSVYNSKELGESSLPEALPYDQVNSIPYQTYYKLDGLLPQLSAKYNVRMKSNPHFYYTLERKQKAEEMSSKKEISLNEAVRKQESLEADKWRLDLENRLRLEFDRPVLESLDELKQDESHADTDMEDKEDDYMQLQVAETLIDFIKALSLAVAAD